jgi:membrane protein DedA with SNARE-associated domain
MFDLPSLLQHYGYLAIFAGTFVEGESMLLLGSYAAHAGYLNMPWVLAAAFSAALVSDQLYFRLGRRYGPQLVARRPTLQIKVARALAIIDGHAVLSVLAMRFLWGFRVALPVAIGMSSMPAGRYLLLDLVGAAVWSAAVSWLGFAAARILSAAVADFRRYEGEIAAALVLLALALVLLRWLPRRANGAR